VAAAIAAEARTLAVIMPTWVGDVVMATPVLRALREHRPDATIHVLCTPGHEHLLDGLPCIDALIPLAQKGWRGPWRTARAIRQTGADVVLLLPNSARSALAARLSRTPVRVGYDRDRRRALLTHAIAVEQHDRPTPTVDYYAHLACAALGVETIDPTPRLVVTESQQREADGILKDVDGPFVLLNPGASKTKKRWPAESFAQAADRLAQACNVRIVINGAPSEAALVRQIIDASACNPIGLQDRGITLGSLKGVIGRAALMITNDTGPRHIAAALGTPMVSLFGPTDHRWTLLRGVREHRLLAEPFLPDTMVADRCESVCRIERIGVRDVVRAAEGLMRNGLDDGQHGAVSPGTA
jgi:heptosyltransferase-2